MKTRLVLIALILISVGGCSESGPTQASGIDAEGREQHRESPERGIKQFAAGTYRTSLCENYPTTACLSTSDWMIICKRAELSQGVSDSFERMAYLNARNSNAVYHLAENGGIQDMRIEWNDIAKDDREKCRIKASAVGLYNGSDINEELEAYVTKIIVREDGVVLAAESNTSYPL